VIRIVASTNVYGDFAAAIGGSDVEVISIIDGPSQDPHGFEASPRVQLALAGADIVILNGGGYDDFVLPMLEASGNDTAIVIDAVTESGRLVAEGFNEHVWYDYPTVAKVAVRIGEALAALDPESAERYRSNVSDLQSDLAGLEAMAAAIAIEARGSGVIITELVPMYLLERCGLNNLTPTEFSQAIEEDSDVPPALLQDVLDIIGDGTAALVVYNAQTGGPQTVTVISAADAAHLPVIAVTETLPRGLAYLDWQSDLLRQIAQALGVDPGT
jgi:zinc/manganese transport system substrate-binding protein